MSVSANRALITREVARTGRLATFGSLLESPTVRNAWWAAVDGRRHPSLQGAGKATRFGTWKAFSTWLLQLGPTTRQPPQSSTGQLNDD